MIKKGLMISLVMCAISAFADIDTDISINELLQNYQYNKVDQILKDVKSFEDIPALNFESLLSEKIAETMSVESQPDLKEVTDLF
jgi:hypothetical protein